MEIGIVGSGIAGLSAAWLLGRQHRVTLFERHDRPGMGAFNLKVGKGDHGATIDVPLRAFNTGYYPNLMALYEAMGVAMQHTDHGATYTSALDNQTYFAYRYLKWRDKTLPMLTNIRHLDPRNWRIYTDAARMLWQAEYHRGNGGMEGMTIDAYLRENGYSAIFVDKILLPSFAAICTCSYPALKQYPAETIVGFLNSGLLFRGIRRARHGADDAIDKMLTHCHSLHCASQVERVSRAGDKVTVEEKNGRRHEFDHVIMATQANQVQKLVAGDREVTDLLAKIPYEKSEVVVHGDTRVAPANFRRQPAVNFYVDPNRNKPMASICLNKIYPALANREALFQTWNPIMPLQEDQVWGRSYFERPLVNHESLAAIKAMHHLYSRQNDRRLWYCGSYAMPGIPLLESAVQSSMRIATRLGVDIPWTAGD